MNTDRLKTLKKAIKYISLAIVIVFVIPVLYLRFGVGDIESVDDSDMKIVLDDVPDDQNAYPFLMLAQLSLRDPVEKRLRDKLSLYNDGIEENGGLDRETLDEALHIFEDRFPTMDKAAAMPFSQGPEITRPDDMIPNYLSLRSLSRLRLERARRYAEEGRTQLALQEALQVFRFATRVSQNDGGTILISIMVGDAIKRITIGVIDEIIEMNGLPTGAEKDIVRTLPIGYDSQQAWINSWKSEYLVMNYILDELQKGSPEGKRIMDDTGLVAPGFIQSFFHHTIFKTERVRKAFHDFHTAMIENARADNYSQVEPFDPAELGMGKNYGFGDYVSLAMQGELGTYIFISMAVPNFNKAVERRFFNDFLIDAMMIKAAALAYRRDKGTVPVKLAELVPEYMETLPVDSFSGRPMQYDAGRGTLCSASVDGIFDGCDTGLLLFNNLDWNELREEKDLVVQLF